MKRLKSSKSSNGRGNGQLLPVRLAVLAVLGLLFLLYFCAKPRFVHVDTRNPYLLLDRTSAKLCWSGPTSDLDAFMEGWPLGEMTEKKPKNLPVCKTFER